MSTLTLGRLVVEITAGNPSRAELRGRIDDSSPLAAVSDALPPGEVVLDTGAVTFINSYGIREWTRLIRVLRERGPIVLERVTDVLVVQMNHIAELGKGVVAGDTVGPIRVVSFHAQYACPACGAERTPVIDAIAHAAELRRLVAPRMPCLECGAQMELGDFPERYLSMFRST